MHILVAPNLSAMKPGCLCCRVTARSSWAVPAASIPQHSVTTPSPEHVGVAVSQMCVVVGMNKRFSSAQFSHSVVSDSLWPHGLQHARPPRPSPTPRVYSNSCPSSWWCHPTISSSVVPFPSCLQFFPASESFQMSQFFVSGGQNIGVSASASVFPMNIQDWFPLGWASWILLQSRGFSRAFSNTTVQRHQFFGTQLSL